MSGALALTLLLSPLIREPVGPDGWQEDPDPLRRRIASLMLGEARRSGAITVLPLLARVPSEAGHGATDAPVWHVPGVSGRILREDSRIYLRVANLRPQAVLVPAGSVFWSGRQEIYITRDAVVAGEFAAFFPARAANGVPGGELARGPLLKPNTTGLLLLGQAAAPAFSPRWAVRGDSPTYRAVLAAPPFSTRTAQLQQAFAPIAKSVDRTVVGAAFFVGDRVAAVHCFATNALFAAALPDIVAGVSLQAEEAILRTPRRRARLDRAGRGLDARGVALAYLRAVLRVRGSWQESYGEGLEVLLRSRKQRVVGHAILDRRERVVHAGFYSLAHWPGDPVPSAGRGPTPGGKPGGGGSESSPGQVMRKPRPTEAEKRRLDRGG